MRYKNYIILCSFLISVFGSILLFQKYKNYESLLIEYYLVIYLLTEEDSNSSTSIVLRNRSYLNILESRHSYFGKTISDRIEIKFPKYKEARINFTSKEASR